MTVHTYTVRRGESVESLAVKFGVSGASLARLNETPFYEGQRVLIPVLVLRLPACAPPEIYDPPRDGVTPLPDGTDIVF